MIVWALVISMLLLAAPAYAQSCEDDRETLRNLARHLRLQREGDEVDAARALMRLQNEIAALKAQIEKLKPAKPAEAPPQP